MNFIRSRALLMAAITAAAAPLDAADEAPAARAYLDRVQALIEQVRIDLPQAIRAADMVAESFVRGRGLGIRGGAGLGDELSYRAGGFQALRPGVAEPGDAILYAFGAGRGPQPLRASVEAELADARRLRDGGSVIVGIASRAQLHGLGLLSEARAVCTVLLDNHVVAPDSEVLEAPLETVANAITAWTLCAELFSACTRRGRTPVVLGDPHAPRARWRWERYRGLRFHHVTKLEPIEPGVLGEAWLLGLRSVLRDVGTASWPALAGAAHRAADTVRAGGRVFVRVGPRSVARDHGGRLGGDPGFFTRLDHDGSDPGDLVPGALVPGERDFVIAIGRDHVPGSSDWGEPEMLRGAGRGVCWVVNACMVNLDRMLVPGELLIDLQCPYDDAVVRVPRYDVPIGPTTGVVAETVWWCLSIQAIKDWTRRSRP